MRTRTIFTALMLIVSISAIAQRSVFEDDIYYTPKSKKGATEVTKVETTTTTTTTTIPQSSSEEPTQNEIDVDAYNRRYTSSDYITESSVQESVPQTTTTTTTTTTTQTYYVNGVGAESMEYAERIRRFHNPEIGIYVVDPEYNNIYLIEEDYTPYIASVNIVTSPWVTPYSWRVTYNPWYYNSWYYNSWYYNHWSYNPWYWPTAYNPYYPAYYPPRPYPSYRPKPMPAPAPSHKPGYRPAPRPSSNHGDRYIPGGSVGTGGRTDGAVRYNKPSSPSKRGQAVTPGRDNNSPRKNTPSNVTRPSSGGGNKGTSTRGGSFERPSYSKPSTSTPSRQSYSPGNSGGRSNMNSSSPIRNSGGSSIGGRGSR